MEHMEPRTYLPNDVTPSIEGDIDLFQEPIPAVEQNSTDLNADNIVISKEDELQSENVSTSEVNVTITNNVKNAELLREQDGMDLNVDNDDICNEDDPDRDNSGNINGSEVNLNIVACDVDNTEILSDNSHLTQSDMTNHMKNLNSDVANESSVDVDKLISGFPPSSPSSSETYSPPSSEKELFELALNISENQTPYSTSRNNFTLPYFQLPNPDLDQFLIETDKNLQTPGMKRSECGFSVSPFKSDNKDKGDIVFTIDSNAHNKVIEIKKSHRFLNHPTSLSSGVICLDEEDNVIKDNHEGPRSSICNEYAKVISSLTQLDESKSPGIKRLALKEYLKKKIDEKKYVAFNRAKEISRLDEEVESDEERESKLDSEENLKSGTESSDEDFEEETVSFDKHEKEGSSELDDEYEDNPLNTKKESELVEELDDENSESDEDIIAVRKPKKVQILEEDSSEESDFLPDLGHSFHADSSLSELESNNTKTAQNNRNDFDSHINLVQEDLIIYPELPLNDLDSETSFSKSIPIEFSEDLNLDEGYCVSLKNDEKEPFEVEHIGLSQISSSIPSHQPGGGFLNQESQDDSSDSIESEITSLKHKNLVSKSYIYDQTLSKFSDFRSSSLLNSPTVEEMSENSFSGPSGTPALGLSLDDLPVSHMENVSDMFSSQDLADLCSGAFKSSAFHEPECEKITKKVILPEDIASDENFADLEELPQEKVKDFFDYEAELSGEDDGLDDDPESDGEDIDNGLYASDHELPPEEELRDEIADLHMKRMLDDDDELLKQIQEQFLDDGELNNDGTGRIRKFAWKNNNVENINNDRDSSSESDTEAALDDTWSPINQEKAKWRQEKDKEEDLNEELNSGENYKRTSLKVNIIGKPKFSRNEEDSSKRLSFKRPRGSFLHLDDSSASQVLKKLKASEDNCSGSRTTKHFVFRNDLSEDAVTVREVPVNLASEVPTDTNDFSTCGSIFNKI